MSGEPLEFRQAIRAAIIEEMERDESVVFFRRGVAAEQGGVFAVTPGIQERFGAARVFDTPISELAITGAAFGAAAAGLRPIIEIMFGDFMGLAMDSLVNQSGEVPGISRTSSAACHSSCARPSAEAGASARSIRRRMAPGSRAWRG